MVRWYLVGGLKDCISSFFKEGGEAACNRLGFRLEVYSPRVYIPLPDGQVMFIRPGEER